MDTSYKEYLSSEVINKIDSISLRAKLVVEGFIIGLHKSPYHGFSIEFSEHRPYGFGDEIKYIDWKLFAKTDKLFIKQFEEETNLKSYILLDKSFSMHYGSNQITKFEYAKTLSACLSYLMIKQQDAVGLSTFDDKLDITVPPKSKIGHLSVLLNILHRSKAKGETKISPILHTLAESMKKRGLVILISDLLDDQDFIDYYLPLVRRDLKLIENYKFNKNVNPLNIAFTVLSGTNDQSTSKSGVLGWKDLSLKSCEFNTINGNHFFVHNKIEDVMNIINKTLL